MDERMRPEYLNNPTLLTSIKRSYARVYKRLRTEKVVTTNLFIFEKMDCSEVEFKFVYLWNFCLKVTVVTTGEKLVITQRFSFGDDLWTMYRIEEE